MINIHPSLLPLFKGTQTHAQALAAGVRLHGCTVHFVVPELDAGPIVAQAAVPVREGDDPDSLAARVIVQERRLYPAALALVAGERQGFRRPRRHRRDAAGRRDLQPLTVFRRDDGQDCGDPQSFLVPQTGRCSLQASRAERALARALSLK